MQLLLLPLAPRFIVYTISLIGAVTLAALAWAKPQLLPYLFLPLALFSRKLPVAKRVNRLI